MVVARPKMAFAPQEVGALALAEIERCIQQASLGIITPWPQCNKKIKPLRPGKLAVIQAYTSNYKTGTMTFWGRWLAEKLRDASKGGEIVVFASWEDTVEDMGIYDLANVARIDMDSITAGKLTDNDLEKLKGAAFTRGALPLWIVGNSSADRAATKRLTMSETEDVLTWVAEKMDVQIRALFIDYVQKIMPEGRGSWGKDGRRTDIMENTFRAEQLGGTLGTPVIMGAQSGRTSNDAKWKVPQPWHAQETSALEQFATLMISQWIPHKTEGLSDPDNPGTWLATPAGTRLEVTENLMIMALLKQKRGPAGGFWPMYIDYEANEIWPMEQEEKDW